MSDRQYAELTRLISQMIQEIGDFRKETNERFDALERHAAKIEEQMEEFKYQFRVIAGDIAEIKGKQWRFDSRLHKLEDEAA